MTPRQERRLTARLNAKADRAFHRLRGRLVAMNAAEDIAIVRGDGTMRVVRGEWAEHVLVAMGLEHLHREIVGGRTSHAFGWVPCVVVIEQRASLQWMETHPLSRGGAA
jgi:hypothetical protein